MTYNRNRHYLIAILTLFLLASCKHHVRPDAHAHPVTPTNRVATSAPQSTCNVVLTVDDEGAHLYLGQQIRLIGPLANNGNYVVQIIGNPNDRTLKPNTYIAKNDLSWEPGIKSEEFTLDSHVPVKDLQAMPPHNTDRIHEYTMDLEYDEYDTDNGCPIYAKFKSGAHPKEEGGDHPGHGGAGN